MFFIELLKTKGIQRLESGLTTLWPIFSLLENCDEHLQKLLIYSSRKDISVIRLKRNFLVAVWMASPRYNSYTR